MPELSEARWRRDTTDLVVAGNGQARYAANLLRKPVANEFDTDGVESWSRSPKDWRRIEEALDRAIGFYTRARNLARHRADAIERAAEDGPAHEDA